MNDIDEVVLQKIEQDSDFQASLESLSDEEKESTIAQKKSELVKQEFKTLAEAKEKAEKNYADTKQRAEKAEKEAKDKVVSPKDSDLTFKDNYALSEAKVPLEDVDEVIEYAKFKKISVADTLKLPIMQARLKETAEFRASENAKNTGVRRPGTKSVSGEQILQDSLKGNIPEPGSKEAEELFWAKRGGRPKN